MRILYHHRTLGDGAEGIHVAEIVRAFERQGHPVRVVSLIGEQTNEDTPNRRRWSRIARLLPRFTYEIGEIAYNVIGYRSIVNAIRNFAPDFIYDRYSCYSCSALYVGKSARIPVILEVNSPLVYERNHYEDMPLYFPRIAEHFEVSMCSGVDKVVTVSSPLKTHLVSLGVPEDKITVMPNGVNHEVFLPDWNGSNVRDKYHLSEHIVLGFVGILRPWHGIEMLLQTFKEIDRKKHKLHLLIVGDGPLQTKLEDHVKTAGLTNDVAFTGRVPHEKIRDYIAAMDMTISPRVTFYASPMKILEYMAMAKPTIAPDIDNIKDIIEDGKEGMLFEPESKESLKKAILTLAEDCSLRNEMGSAARKKIERGYTWDHNARWVIEIARELLVHWPQNHTE